MTLVSRRGRGGGVFAEGGDLVIVSATPPADVELSADANRSYVDKKSKFYVVTPGMHDRIKRLHVRLLVEGEELVVGGLSALEVVPEVGGVEPALAVVW